MTDTKKVQEYSYHIYPSTLSGKKYEVYVPTPGRPGHFHLVHFGATGYQDYTIHHDPKRLAAYQARHQHDHIDDPQYPGFWSWNILWNLPDLQESYEDTLKRYNLRPEPINK